MARTDLKNTPVQASDQPRAAVSPPTVFVAAIVLGVVLDLLVPVDLLPGAAQLSAGLPVIGFSVFLSAVSFRSFAKNGTTAGHKEKPVVLITNGPFGYTRNPLYLSGLLLVLGFGFLLDSIWIFALTIPVMIIVHYGAVLKEEDYLLDHFGKEYEQYKTSVRRWI
ncbi:MAG: isoprenylcysteine carboxylmethyltransferase family protein [Spirochaetaceae bacterium]|nr:MAG: isoprenylcysteine carboxylmethyltransferase family protein [Spirochaetaceae bacterium]